MLATLTTTLKLWKPAIVSDVEKRFENQTWGDRGLKNTAALQLRAAGSFLLAVPLFYKLFRNVSATPLISRATLLEIAPSFIGHPNLYAVVQLASLPLNILATLVCAVAAACLYHYLEYHRAEKALDSFAIEKFNIQNPVDAEIMVYLTQHPDAVKNLTQKDANAVLAKKTHKSSTLINIALSQFEQKQTKERVQVIDLLLDATSDQRSSLSKDTFIGVIQTNFPPFLHKCFTERIKPTDWQFEDTAENWKWVKNDLCAQLLLGNLTKEEPEKLLIRELSKQIRDNFDDVQQKTCKSYFSSLANIYFLLKNGAFISDLDQSLSIEVAVKDGNLSKKETISKPLSKWLQNEPQIEQALKQAQSGKRLFLNTTLTTPSLFFFWKPAVDPNLHRVDEGLIILRTGIVAWVSFMAVLPFVLNSRAAASFLATLIIPLIIPSVTTAFITTLYHKYAWKSASGLLSEEVFHLYSSTRFHSSTITGFICDSPETVQKIIDAKLDLFKQDETGTTFWRELLRSDELSGQRLESFKLIAEHAFKKGTAIKTPFDYFIQAIQAANPAAVSHILVEQKFIKPGQHDSQPPPSNELNDAQQFQCWMSNTDRWRSTPKSLKILDILHSAGFNINAKDSDGFTPLLKLASLHHIHKNHRHPLLEKLIHLGADLKATVIIDGQKKELSNLLSMQDDLEIMLIANLKPITDKHIENFIDRVAKTSAQIVVDGLEKDKN